MKKNKIFILLISFLVILGIISKINHLRTRPFQKIDAREIGLNLLNNRDDKICKKIKQPKSYCDKISQKIQFDSKALKLADAAIWVQFIKEEEIKTLNPSTYGKKIVQFWITTQAKDSEELKFTFRYQRNGSYIVDAIVNVMPPLTDEELTERLNAIKKLEEIKLKDRPWEKINPKEFSINLIKNKNPNLCLLIKKDLKYCSTLFHDILHKESKTSDIADLATWFDFVKEYQTPVMNPWTLTEKAVVFKRTNQKGEAAQITLFFQYNNQQKYGIDYEIKTLPNISKEEITDRLNGKYNSITHAV